MLTNTRRRLNEAEFFLEKMVESHLGEAPVEFDYYLSAFLSSARAVLWVMRAEFGRVSGWEPWFKSLEPQDPSLLDGITEMRNRSEKRGPVVSTETLVLTFEGLKSPPNEIWQRENKFFITIETTSPDGVTTTSVEEVRPVTPFKCEDIFRSVDEFPLQDILKVGRDYWSWLKSIVEECEGRFTPGL